jgi:hypothetical protein
MDAVLSCPTKFNVTHYYKDIITWYILFENVDSSVYPLTNLSAVLEIFADSGLQDATPLKSIAGLINTSLGRIGFPVETFTELIPGTIYFYRIRTTGLGVDATWLAGDYNFSLEPTSVAISDSTTVIYSTVSLTITSLAGPIISYAQTQFDFHVLLAGDKNGVNKIFTFPDNYIAIDGKYFVFYGATILIKDVGYSITDNIITLDSSIPAPQSEDVIWAGGIWEISQ